MVEEGLHLQCVLTTEEVLGEEVVVIEQTIKQKLPEGFQKSEFQLEHGLIDNVIERKDLKSTLARLLNMLQNKPKEITGQVAEKIPKLTNPPEVLGA